MNQVKSTKYDGISIRLTWTPRHGAPTWIRGYLINSKTGIRLDGYTEIKRKADSEKEIEIVKEYVINTLLEKAAPKRTEKRDGSSYKNLDTSSSIVQTFIRIKEEQKPIKDWADSTRRGAMSYFEHNVLPEIQHCQSTEDFTREDYDHLKAKLTEYSLSNTRSKKRLENADAGAGTHLYESAVIYAAMQEVNPTLPEIPLLVEGKKARIQVEQVKSIPVPIHKRYRKEVESLVNEDPSLARAAALVDSGGLRPAEAAAVDDESFTLLDNCLVVAVMYQEQDGKRIARLKTDNGYRRVVLDEWGSEVVTKCNELLKNNPLKGLILVRGQEVSRWMRSALKKSGCDEDYIKSAMQILKSRPEYDESGMPDSDVAAYILRRNRASIWKNFCGYTQEEIDYLLGHRKIKKGRRTINTQDIALLKNWIQKNSRYDIDPEISNNPAHRPIQLVHGTEADIVSFKTMRLKNVSTAPLKVTLNIVTAEAGELVIIKTNGKMGDRDRCSSQIIKKRKRAEIIGFIPDEERNEDEEKK